jgi:type IV secretion system protein VirB6
MSVQIFDDLMTAFDSVVDTYFITGSAAVASSFLGVAKTMLILYVVLYGWSMMRGLIQEPVTESAERFIKIGVLYALATSAGLYGSYVSDFLYNWPAALTGAVTGAVATTTTQMLDNIASQGLDLAVKAWQAADITNIGAYFIALILFAQVLILTAVCGFILLTAKVVLSLALTLGPIFILSYLFKPTRRLFDGWIGVTVGAGFTIVITGLAAHMAFKVYEAAFNAAATSAAATDGIPSLTDIAPATVAGVMIALLMFRLPSMAGALAQGSSVAGAEMAQWAYNRMRGMTGNTANSLRNLPSRRTNTDDITDDITKGREGGNISPQPKPMSVYRKITARRSYRQAA